MWLFWDASLEFEFISISDQALSGWFVSDSVQVLVSIVYASYFQRKRRELWKYLRALDAGVWPCFVGGDFNIVYCDEEKVGGLLSAYRTKEYFNTCLHDCGHIELPSRGEKFS